MIDFYITLIPVPDLEPAPEHGAYIPGKQCLYNITPIQHDNEKIK